MTRNRITIDVSTLPWPEDVIISTHSKRDDWLFGLREIAKALETPESTVYGWLEQGRLKCYRVRNPDRRTIKINSFVWMVGKDEAMAFYKAHISPTQPAPTSNGKVIDMVSGVELPTAADIRAHKIALSENTLALKDVAQALRENTEVWKK